MSRRGRLTRLHDTVPYKALAGIGAVSFVLDVVFIRLFPGWVDAGAATTLILYGASLGVLLVAVLLLRALLKPSRLVEALAVVAIAAALPHGLALALVPGLYGDASSARGGGAWVLSSLGAMLALGVLFERRATRGRRDAPGR